MTKNEMINRSSGHGMFLYNYNFRNNRRSMNNIHKRMNLDESNEQDKIQINLRKINWFGKQRNKRPVNILFHKTFLKMTFEDYKKLQTKNKEEQLKAKTINANTKQLYKKSSKRKEQVFKLKNKNNEKTNGKQSCEKIRYIISEINNKINNARTHLYNINQKRKQVEGTSVKTI